MLSSDSLLTLPPDPATSGSLSQSPSLPFELIEEVAGYLRGDTQTLCTLALVSKATLECSRKYLCSQLALSAAHPQCFHQFISLLDKPWTSFISIQKIHLHGSFLSGLAPSSDYRPPDDRDRHRVIQHLPNLKAMWLTDLPLSLFSYVRDFFPPGLEEIQLDCTHFDFDSPPTREEFLSWFPDSVKRISWYSAFSVSRFEPDIPLYPCRAFHLQAIDTISLEVAAIWIDLPSSHFSFEEFHVLPISLLLDGRKWLQTSDFLAKFGSQTTRLHISTAIWWRQSQEDNYLAALRALNFSTCKRLGTLHLGPIRFESGVRGRTDQGQVEYMMALIPKILQATGIAGRVKLLFLTFQPQENEESSGVLIRIHMLRWTELISRLREECPRIEKVVIRVGIFTKGQPLETHNEDLVRATGLRDLIEEGLVDLRLYGWVTKPPAKSGNSGPLHWRDVFSDVL